MCLSSDFSFVSFQALKHFMKSPSTEDNLAIEMAIETVSNFAKTKNSSPFREVYLQCCDIFLVLVSVFGQIANRRKTVSVKVVSKTLKKQKLILTPEENVFSVFQRRVYEFIQIFVVVRQRPLSLEFSFLAISMYDFSVLLIFAVCTLWLERSICLHAHSLSHSHRMVEIGRNL